MINGLRYDQTEHVCNEMLHQTARPCNKNNNSQNRHTDCNRQTSHTKIRHGEDPVRIGTLALIHNISTGWKTHGVQTLVVNFSDIKFSCMFKNYIIESEVFLVCNTHIAGRCLMSGTIHNYFHRPNSTYHICLGVYFVDFARLRHGCIEKDSDNLCN